MPPEGSRPDGGIMLPEGSIMWPVGGIMWPWAAYVPEGRGHINIITWQGQYFVVSGPAISARPCNNAKCVENAIPLEL